MSRILDALGWLALIAVCYLLVALLWLPLTVGRRLGWIRP